MADTTRHPTVHVVYTDLQPVASWICTLRIDLSNSGVPTSFRDLFKQEFLWAYSLMAGT